MIKHLSDAMIERLAEQRESRPPVLQAEAEAEAEAEDRRPHRVTSTPLVEVLRPAASAVGDEHITEPARIADLLAALVRERAPAWLRLPSEARVPVSVVGLDERGVVVTGGRDILPSPLRFEWLGHNSLFRGSAEPRLQEGGTLLVPAPGAIDRVQNRSFRRVLLSTQILVRWRRPADGASGLLAVRDLSCEGLSAWCGGDAGPQVQPGDACTLSVVSGVATAIELSALVRNFGQPLAGGSRFVGFQVRPLAAQDGAGWLALVERHLHPRVRVEGEDLEAVWSLYQDAGYLALSGKRPTDFFDIKASFLGATSRALKAPEVALQAVWPERGPPLATLSAVRLYENSWLGFHMAKKSGTAPDGTPGRLVLREIHLSVYERIQRDAGARWIIGHTQVKPVWSRLCHHEITRRFVEAGDAAVWRFRAIEVRRAPAVPERPRGCSVGLASRAETALVLTALARRLPEPMVEALDLVPRRFDLQSVRRRWWTAGLQRDRGLLVARRGEEIIAALLMELSDEGLHVFRLLDHALPISLAPGGRAFFPALLAAAHEWYFARGREAWACFADAGINLELGPEMYDLGEADMCILSTSRMPEFFEHLQRINASHRESDPVS
jgi:hypothetical protein